MGGLDFLVAKDKANNEERAAEMIAPRCNFSNSIGHEVCAMKIRICLSQSCRWLPTRLDTEERTRMVFEALLNPSLLGPAR